MNITMKNIFRGCLIASIAHAIMSNVYPDLSYEQSWDGTNYSIQDSFGLRGTITFTESYCVGAIRNEKLNFNVDETDAREYFKNFPLSVFNKACEETLQYLLSECNGVVKPCVTSAFWVDDIGIHFNKRYIENIANDFSLLKKITLPINEAKDKWIEYYNMDANAIKLLDDLYKIKSHDFCTRIVLNEEQKSLIPGSFINEACIEALSELNIEVG